MFEWGAALTVCAVSGVCVGLMGVAFVVWYVLGRRTRAAWQQFADQMGLTCKTGGGSVCVSGPYRGRALKLESSTLFNPVGQDAVLTRMSVQARNPGQLEFSMVRSWTGGVLAQATGGIRLGDEELDRRYAVRGQPAARVGQILTSPAVRARLLRLSKGAWIAENNELRYENSGVERDARVLAEIAELLNAMANELEGQLEQNH